MILHAAVWINLASYISHLCSKEWNCGLWACMKTNLILLEKEDLREKKLENVTIFVFCILWWLESWHSYACELLVPNAQKHNVASVQYTLSLHCLGSYPIFLAQHFLFKINNFKSAPDLKRPISSWTLPIVEAMCFTKI